MGVVSAIAQVMRQNLCEKQSSAASSNSLVPGTETILAMLQGARTGPASLQSFKTCFERCLIGALLLKQLNVLGGT